MGADTVTREPLTREPLTRAPLTRERIISAAVVFADEHGIDVLSMRKLGQVLGVEAMSLYNHVESKDDILDGMIDHVFEEIGLPEPADDWRVSVRQTAVAAKAVFTAHPWSVPLMTARNVVTESLLALMEAMLAMLLDAGYPVETTHHAWHVIASHVMGYAFQESSAAWGRGADHDHGKVEALLRANADRFPNVVAMAPHMMECSYADEFEFGLDVIIAGIEARRDT